MLVQFLHPRVADLQPNTIFQQDGAPTFSKPALEEVYLGNIWFQQDGATSHTSRASVTVLRAKFPGRLISLRGDIPWAAHSPDLTPCDFFMGIPQGKVFKHRPTNLLQLKNVIRHEVAHIPVHILERAEGNFRKRLPPPSRYFV
ncbi:hypothetical protein B7P43_G00513 [Cryptotermes secundus]|uniref:Tc1-like transposase DDE domain-containing protein n=1 Tax=Cryptotermes secundus TaxID=105785 RepID=A0A2J7R685_9NEOP|nr:hypothetical protein B7P43_G00513 [Cryptotermes secundus]